MAEVTQSSSRYAEVEASKELLAVHFRGRGGWLPMLADFRRAHPQFDEDEAITSQSPSTLRALSILE